jgi:hypothetical protein
VKTREGATRAEAEQALLAFLQKVASMQPAPDLRKSGVVRNALNTLAFANGPLTSFVDVNAFLKEVPNDPAQIAQRFAQRLPASINRQALEKLKSLAAADSPEGGAVSRVVDKFKNAAPGGPDPVDDPSRVNPADQGDKEAAIMRRWAGVDDPKTVGPVAIDVLQASRFLSGLGKTVNPPTPQKPPPVAGVYPEVEAAIAKIPDDALIPAEAKGKGQDDNYASARAFARDVARRMDVAQQSGLDTIQINLGDNYAQVKNRAALTAAIESIIAQMRAALPNHASGVINVDIVAGKTWLTRGRVKTE